MLLLPGDTVRLIVPENPNLHRAEARVDEVTDWGAHVLTSAAVTGRFRALFSEMEFCDGRAVLSTAEAVSASNQDQYLCKDGGDTPIDLVLHTAVQVNISTQMGYTGDVCDICGSDKMRRSGVCSVCEECGSTSSCS